ncbi:hypothetical protein FACS1894211_10660 [Clostridia bacterium]|nr:hypothetical protein FACS1894211_10660 [Clostridia bacterium]
MDKVHLISNAHLDPVWQWEWQEGAGAAVTTFSAAADFCEEFGDFIFCHNEAVLYQWVEEYDRPLFERIVRLVKAGKWNIMGGWFLQPDCNMPAGESFIRQILAGKRFFEAKFEGYKMPKTALNLDSFGHTRGLVQILKDAGQDYYLCTRPATDVADRDMLWKGFAGSEVIVHRSSEGYNTLLGRVAEKIEPYIARFADVKTGLVLWGVGNHGGGPSRRDYAAINDLKKKYPAIRFEHSTPDKYFAEIEKRRGELRETPDMNHLHMAAYTSQARVKQRHMLLENELYSAEKAAAHAAAAGSGFEYPADALARAERDLLFNEFHDILPGTSVRGAEAAALIGLGHGLEEVSRVKLKAFFALAAGEKKAAAGEYPIFIYNPHPYPLTRTVECEFMLADQNWSETEFYEASLYHEGRKLEAQPEKEESSLPLDWRKRMVFRVDLKPFAMHRVSCFTKLKKVKKRSLPRFAAGKYEFKGANLQATVNQRTGLIDGVTVNGKEYIRGGAFRVDVIKYCSDPWGFRYDDYKERLGGFTPMSPKEAARFAAVDAERLPPVRVIEDGAVRTVIEAFFKYGSSSMVIKYLLPKRGTDLEVRILLYNAEKDVKLKLLVPTAIAGGDYFGETAFGLNRLKTDGDEVVAQGYTVLADRTDAVSLINFGNYGSDCKDGVIGATLLNSAAYTAHPIDNRRVLRQDRISPRIDQGEREFRFIITASGSKERFESIAAESLAAHQPPTALSFFPTGTGKPAGRFIEISDKAVILTAVKRAERGGGCVLRLWNGTDAERAAEVALPFIGRVFRAEFRPYQFKSFKVEGDRIEECSCLEEEKTEVKKDDETEARA